MFKQIFLLFFLLSMLLAIPVSAQEAPSFSSMTVDLWPEYDQPNMLLIYKGLLSSQVSLPAELKFRIPAAAGKPTAVAVGPDAASVADVPFTTQVNGDWTEVSFTATTPAVQLEFYDPALTKDGAKRTYEYHWPGDVAVDALTIEVQTPKGASGMSISPNMGKTVQDQQGFVYNIIDVGAVTAGDPFTLDLTYQKNSDTLSIENLPIEPSAPIPTGASSRLSLGQIWPWLLGALGVLLIVGGGLWYWRSGREATSARRERRRKPVMEKSESSETASAVYCHQCGRRAEPGDRFCRSCGIRLRVE